MQHLAGHCVYDSDRLKFSIRVCRDAVQYGVIFESGICSF
jgi:hypothetical protein